MTRDGWIAQFEDELKKLRPHVGDRMARTLALQKHDPKEHPRELARQYDKSLRPANPAPTHKKAR